MLIAHATASTTHVLQPSKEWAWVGSLSVGPTWANSGATQTIYLTPDIEKAYVVDQKMHSFISGAFFAGLQKKLTHQLIGQLGIAIATSANASLQGDIWDDASSEFDNYSYQYKLHSTQLSAKGKLLLDRGYWVLPWVSASVGLGFNLAHGFNNTPLIDQAVQNPNFGDHTTTSFSYTIGAGIQKALNHHWQIGAGYELTDWGRSQLARAYGQTLNNGLSLNHFYTNGLMFNLTYLA